MSDSFFDMPSGYSDADMEMAELERRGNDHYRRYGRRKIDAAGIATLSAGGTVELAARRKEDGFTYTVTVKAIDEDDLGPCDFRYTMDAGETWHESARAALEDWQAAFASR